MIYRWMHEGRFGHWTVKRRGFERGVRYIDKQSFLAWLESQRVEIHYGPLNAKHQEVRTS
jgi:hypothetical protein